MCVTEESSVCEESSEPPLLTVCPSFSSLLLSSSSSLSLSLGRSLFFSRHGESEFNVEERIGGDPPLTRRGRLYAEALGQYINALELSELKVWTSNLLRARETSRYVICGSRTATSLLDELHSGAMDGYSYEEIRAKFPKEWNARQKDKLRYCYPQGESYLNCCERISPLLVELEQQDNLLVISHQATLRCIFGYLLRRPLEQIPYIKIPQHTIIQVTWDGEENCVSFTRIPIPHVEQGVTAATTEQGCFQLESTDPDQEEIEEETSVTPNANASASLGNPDLFHSAINL